MELKELGLREGICEMRLVKNYLLKNRCYKAAKKIVPKGIVVHSTATPQENVNVYLKSWNRSDPDMNVCVHAFVAEDGVYQTLPWNYKSWGCGSGSKGSYNSSHIQFEILEPNGTRTTDKKYDSKKNDKFFKAVYANAVELCAKLCLEFTISVEDIVCHSEAHAKGYASNHADVMHWFPKHGKSMKGFRRDVANKIKKGTTPSVLYRVQVGAFYMKLKATNLSKKLSRAGYSNIIVKSGKYYKVQVGAFRAIDNAKKLQRELINKKYAAIIV